MDDLIVLNEVPQSQNMYMIAGWRQWADAGSTSSGLPHYLIKRLRARKIGEIKPDGFYLFQIPGTHHLLRPVVKLQDGYRQSLERKQNELYYWGDEERGLVIFLGDEPHISVERYSQAFLAAAKKLNVKRIIGTGGVYGPVPYDREREVSCIYSLPALQDELEQYGVRFSNYEGGASIGSVLVDQAEAAAAEMIVFYSFVPAYDFSRSTTSSLANGVSIENDYKAWYDVIRRINHMFQLNLDLSDLQRRSNDLIAVMDAKIEELEQESPSLKIRDYLEQLDTAFTETLFTPLADFWDEELGDIFDDID